MTFMNGTGMPVTLRMVNADFRVTHVVMPGAVFEWPDPEADLVTHRELYEGTTIELAIRPSDFDREDSIALTVITPSEVEAAERGRE